MTGFVFFESFYEMLNNLDDEMKCRFTSYICEYGLYGTEPKDLDGGNSTGIEHALWVPIKLSIDASHAKTSRGRPYKQPQQAQPVFQEQGRGC